MTEGNALGTAYCLRELRAYAVQNPGTPLTTVYQTIYATIKAQAARIKELEAERNSWKDDDLNGRVAYDTLREERDALKARCEALEAACRRQVENIERWQETGEPAGPEESNSIYEQLRAALRAAGE